MSLLFDRVRRANRTPELASFFKNAQVILASNISKYFFQESPKEFWKAEDFPNVAPPFPDMWVECERPDYILSEVHGRTEWDDTLRPNRFAAAIRSWRYEDLLLPQFSENYLQIEKAIRNLDVRPKWILHCLNYMHFRHMDWVQPDPIFTWLLPVDENGAISTRDGQPITMYSAIPHRGEEHSRNMRDECEPSLHCALLTLSFMHCSNVHMKDNQPKEHHSKVHQKQYHLPLVTYKTLEIEPMKRVLRREGQSNSQGIQKAMSVCRAHFKHFGPQWGTRKLFGKYEGTFWWPSHVQGSIKKGVVVKDYELKPPKPGITNE